MASAIKDNYCGVSEAAAIIGCTTGRVRQLLIAGKLVGEKYVDADNAPWAVDRKSVAAYSKVVQKTGRPRNRISSAG